LRWWPAQQMGISIQPVLMCVCIACAGAFLTPVATPTNLMVMEPGAYKFTDYWKLGLPMLIWFFIIAVFVVPMIWSILTGIACRLLREGCRIQREEELCLTLTPSWRISTPIWINALDRLFQTVRLKSISTDPAYAAETRKCAEWHAADLASIGFKAEVRETPGHPVVLAKEHSATGTKVLFYGHYDVQPADPLELWTDEPFDPVIVTLPDGSKEIRGRGRRTTRASSDLCRGLPRLEGGHRQAADPDHRPAGRRGGIRRGEPAGVPGCGEG
jgi:hypothetical protein